MKKTPYIIWFNSDYDYDTLLSAFELVNGKVYEGNGDDTWLLDMVNADLKQKGFEPDTVSSVLTLEQYLVNENLHDITPTKHANKHSAAVYTHTPMDCMDWIDFFRREDFHHRVKPDYCIEVFSGVLHGSADVTYEMFNDICARYGVSDDDPPLVLRDSSVPGYTDIVYLLKDRPCQSDRSEQMFIYMQQLDREDLRWLYRRNVEAINRWMAQTKLDLWGYADEGGEESNSLIDKLADVVCNWAAEIVCQVEQEQTD